MRPRHSLPFSILQRMRFICAALCGCLISAGTSMADNTRWEPYGIDGTEVYEGFNLEHIYFAVRVTGNNPRLASSDPSDEDYGYWVQLDPDPDNREAMQFVDDDCADYVCNFIIARSLIPTEHLTPGAVDDRLSNVCAGVPSAQFLKTDEGVQYVYRARVGPNATFEFLYHVIEDSLDLRREAARILNSETDTPN